MRFQYVKLTIGRLGLRVEVKQGEIIVNLVNDGALSKFGDESNIAYRTEIGFYPWSNIGIFSAVRKLSGLERHVDHPCKN